MTRWRLAWGSVILLALVNCMRALHPEISPIRATVTPITPRMTDDRQVLYPIIQQESSGSVRRLSFSDDGKYLAVIDDERLYLWSVNERTLLHTYQYRFIFQQFMWTNSDSFSLIGINYDGRSVVSAYALIGKQKDLTYVRTPALDVASGIHSAFSTHSKMVHHWIVIGLDGRVNLYDSQWKASHSPISSKCGPSYETPVLAPDSKYIAIYCDDHSVSILAGLDQHNVTLHRLPNKVAQFIPSSNYSAFIIREAVRKIDRINVVSAQPQGTSFGIPDNEFVPRNLALSTDEKFLISRFDNISNPGDGTRPPRDLLVRWNTQSGQLHRSSPMIIPRSPDGLNGMQAAWSIAVNSKIAMVAVGDDLGIVSLRDIGTGNYVGQLGFRLAKIDDIAILADGTLLTASGTRITQWSMPCAHTRGRENFVNETHDKRLERGFERVSWSVAGLVSCKSGGFQAALSNGVGPDRRIKLWRPTTSSLIPIAEFDRSDQVCIGDSVIGQLSASHSTECSLLPTVRWIDTSNYSFSTRRIGASADKTALAKAMILSSDKKNFYYSDLTASSLPDLIPLLVPDKFIPHPHSSISVSNDRRIALGTICATENKMQCSLMAWSTQTGRSVFSARLHSANRYPNVSHLSGDGKNIYSISNGTLYEFEVKSNQKRHFTHPYFKRASVIDSLDHDTILIGSADGYLLIARKGRITRSYASVPAAIQRISAIANRSNGSIYVATLDSGGKVSIWTINGDSVKLTATITEFWDQEWIISTPDGYISHSRNAAERIRFGIRGSIESLSTDQYPRVNDPSLVVKRIYGEKTLPQLPAISLPMVSVNQGRLDGDIYKLSTKVVVPGGQGSFQVFLEGHAIYQANIKDSTVSVDVSIPVHDQNNRLTLLAYDSKQKIWSRPMHIDIGGVAQKIAKRDLWLVVVGVSNYKTMPNLPNLVPDAEAFADLMQMLASRSGYYHSVHVQKLVSTGCRKPTKSSILSALRDLRAMRPNDVALIVLSGHGILVNGETQLLAHNSDEASPNDSERIRWDDLEQLLREAPGRTAVFLNSCYAASLIPKVLSPIAHLPSNNIVSGRAGSIIIASSRGWQTSLAENPRDRAQQHSAFMSAVLEALSDPESDLDGDGNLKLSELFSVIQSRVFTMTQGAQVPTIARQDFFGDFTLLPINHDIAN